MSPAEQLYGLPVPIQAELAAIVRVLLGMDEAEKRNACDLLTTVAAFWAVHGRDIDSSATELLTAVAGLVTAAEDAATPTRKEAV